MLEGDWLEHERTGCDVDRESTGDDSHVTVRLQILLHPRLQTPTERAWRQKHKCPIREDSPIKEKIIEKIGKQQQKQITRRKDSLTPLLQAVQRTYRRCKGHPNRWCIVYAVATILNNCFTRLVFCILACFPFSCITWKEMGIAEKEGGLPVFDNDNLEKKFCQRLKLSPGSRVKSVQIYLPQRC